MSYNNLENVTIKYQHSAKGMEQKIEQESGYRLTSWCGPMFGGWILGAKISAVPTATISAHGGWPIVGAGLLGSLITVWPWSFIAKGLRELLIYQPGFIRATSLFAFHFSMTFLSIFVGLLILSSFASLAFSPFTLPCLISAAVAGGVVFVAATAVALGMRYVVTKKSDENVANAIPATTSEATINISPPPKVLHPARKLLPACLPWYNTRFFNHHQIEKQENRDNGCWLVQPLGTELIVEVPGSSRNAESLYVYSLSSLFGKPEEIQTSVSAVTCNA